MWAKSIITPTVLIPTLVFLQISYGIPTENSPLNFTEQVPPVPQDEDGNSSIAQQTASFLLTVLAPNDTSSGAPQPKSIMQLDLDANLTATEEPEYYLEDKEDDRNSSTNSTEASSTLSVLEDDFDTKMTNSTNSSAITEEEMDAAGSVDAVTSVVALDHISTERSTDSEETASLSIASSQLNINTVHPMSHGADEYSTESVLHTTEVEMMVTMTTSGGAVEGDKEEPQN